MNLYELVNRLSGYVIDDLVERIDKNWFLNNRTGLMGIPNKRFLCNYIEDNINKDTVIMKSEYIQDILYVYKLDFRKIKTPNFSKFNNLPFNPYKLFYSLIGRIDKIDFKIQIIDLIDQMEFFKFLISNIFDKEFDEFRTYHILKLNNMIYDIIYFGTDIPIRYLYQSKNIIKIWVDYYKYPTARSPNKIRQLCLSMILYDDIDNFKLIYNDLHNNPGTFTLVTFEDLNADRSILERINTYGGDILAFICSTGRIEFIKYIRHYFRRHALFSINNGVNEHYYKNYRPDIVNDETSDDGRYVTPIFLTNHNYTYLGIALKYQYYDIANFLLNTFYLSRNFKFYDVIKDLKLHLAKKPDILNQYIQYCTINREFSIFINDFFTKSRQKSENDEDKLFNTIIEFIQKGANPNLYIGFANSSAVITPLTKMLIMRLYKCFEGLVNYGFDINYLDEEGKNCTFYISDSNEYNLCKRLGANFNIINYKGDNLLLDFKFFILDELVQEQGLDINYRNGTNYYETVILDFNLFPKLDEIVEKYPYVNLDIITKNGLDLTDVTRNNRPGDMTAIEKLLFKLGYRGARKYKTPMFYIPINNTNCPETETVNLVEVNNPEDDIILMFKNLEYSEATFRHKQEPMCIALSELEDLYFKLRPGTDEFEWNLPTTRNTNRLGFDQIDNPVVIKDLIKVLEYLLTDPKYTDDQRLTIVNTKQFLERNFALYFRENEIYYRMNKQLFNSMNENQHKILNLLMMKVFQIGMYMRRWGGDEELTMKLYNKAEKFPYPMSLVGGNEVNLSNGVTMDILEAYRTHVLIRSRDYPVDRPTEIVPYAEDVSAEQLSIIDHFISNYLTVKNNQDILDYQTADIFDLLGFIRNSKLDLGLILKEINSSLPISNILNDVENNRPVPINLTTQVVYEHFRKRVKETGPLEKFYKNILEFTFDHNEIETTNRRLYHTLDAIRPRNGTVDEAALGDCIQLRGADFILTGYKYFEIFVPNYVIEGFDISKLRFMHY